MKFLLARCEPCGRHLSVTEELIAFRRTMTGGEIEEVDLEGEQPWSGIRCICKKCCRFVMSHSGLTVIR